MYFLDVTIYHLPATVNCCPNLRGSCTRRLYVSTPASKIKHVTWNYKANAVVGIGKMKQWGILANLVPSHLPSPLHEARSINFPSAPKKTRTTRREPTKARMMTMGQP